MQTAAHILQAHASVAVFALRHLAVLAGEVEAVVLDANLDVDEGVLLVTHAVLEGVLHEGDEHQRRYLAVGGGLWHLYVDVHMVGHPHAHQLDVVVEEDEFLAQGHFLLGALIEHEAHDFGQFDDGLLGLFGVDVHQRMDVVEGVHQEVGVDLILQILQLLLQVLTLQFGQSLRVAAVAEVVLDAQVEAEHEQEDDDGHDVVLTDEDGRAAVVLGPVGLGAVLGPVGLDAVKGLVVGLRTEVGTLELLDGRKRGLGPHVGPVDALHGGEDGEQGGKARDVEGTAATIDDERCQQEVVDGEGNEEEQVLHPHLEETVPGERGLRGVVEGVQIGAQYGCYEQDGPYHGIQEQFFAVVVFALHGTTF